ncbi:MAG TPA: histidine kinase [Pyrinomonadaceae bacterium]|nr:histidine kinase [Pyrinomonadaceae bacterium]
MRKALAQWVLIWGTWNFIALYSASEIIFRQTDNLPVDVWGVLLRELINGNIWFLLTPVVIWLSLNKRISKPNWLGGVIFHITAGLIISFFQSAIYSFVLRLIGLSAAPNTYFQDLQNQLTFHFHFNFFSYWVVFGVTYTIDYYRKYRERDLFASQLETRLTRAQLDALKMQLHPHFLFNTLNTISVLMEKDVKAANRMLVNLSDLLRMALDNIGTQEVSLKDELEFLERYLKIEETRFEERLKVRMNVEPETLDARVPNLILQPLVENAIKHGISPQIAGGTIEIRAEREGQTLRLSVRDSGAGIGNKELAKIKKGIGLANTQARLKQMYDGNHTFQINSEEGNGFSVNITIPFRTSEG